MNSFGTFLLQIGVFLNGGMAIHTLMLWVPDNTYEPSLVSFVLFSALGITASIISFKGYNER